MKVEDSNAGSPSELSKQSIDLFWLSITKSMG